MLGHRHSHFRKSMINRKNWKQQKKNKKNKGKWLSVSALMCEMLGTHHFHLYNKKKLKQLILNDLPWTHQRIEFAEKTGSPKSIEIGESREYSEICLPGAEANEVINLNNNFDKLLEAESGGHSLRRGPYLFIIISGNSTRFSLPWEKSLYGSGKSRDGVNIVKYAQSIFRNKAHSPGGKALPEPIPPGIKKEHFFHSSPLDFLPHSRVEEERTKKYLWKSQPKNTDPQRTKI